MRKVIVFGNSGSGKSTYARALHTEGLAHLDLDSIAWESTQPPVRKPLEQAAMLIADFTAKHASWVIEGCYTDLLKLAAEHASEAVFMNLDISLCIENAKSRPWEPHKYATKAAQDKNLPMLIDWISQYGARSDTFSKSAHEDLYARFNGTKVMISSNTSHA